MLTCSLVGSEGFEKHANLSEADLVLLMVDYHTSYCSIVENVTY